MSLLHPAGAAANAPPPLIAAPRRVGPPVETGADKPRARILACVNESALNQAVVKQALAVARGLDLPVTVARVLEMPPHRDAPADPVEWEMRRSECRRSLEKFAAADHGHPVDLDTVLLAGAAADELNRWAKDHGVTLMVLATHEPWQKGYDALGSTAYSVLHQASSSVLLVPARELAAPADCYRRLLLPLDGSPRAESVLPVALRIARAHGAELLLAHAVPKIEVVEDRLAESEGRMLCARLQDHNERRARAYLDELRGRLQSDGVPVRTMVVTHGDPRALMRRLVSDQQVDLIIVSSHGRSGMSEVPVGSVTEYLANHAPVPLLILRPNFAHVFAEPEAPDRIAATCVAAPAH